ncbi:hypothetical protein D3C87_2090060 [compost metagenome]
MGIGFKKIVALMEKMKKQEFQQQQGRFVITQRRDQKIKVRPMPIAVFKKQRRRHIRLLLINGLRRVRMSVEK